MPDRKDLKRYLDRAIDAYDDASEKVTDVKDKARSKIEEHPFSSVLTAAAIGAIAGVATAEIIRAIRRSKR